MQVFSQIFSITNPLRPKQMMAQQVSALFTELETTTCSSVKRIPNLKNMKVHRKSRASSIKGRRISDHKHPRRNTALVA